MTSQLNKITPREYQLNIFENAKVYNTLVVLPTGLGKTLIAILLIKHRLNVYPDSKAILLAPTKPLAEQHKKSLEELTDFKVALFTGNTKPEKRKDLFQESDVIVATPQTIENDIINKNIDLKNVSVVVFDEAHRAVGDYAYVFISEQYMKNSKFPRILALTASPGHEIEKILEICKNLFIQYIETRTPFDKDVSPYVKKTNIFWVTVELDETFKKIRNHLLNLENEFINNFNNLKLVKLQKPVSKKTILLLQTDLKKHFPDDPRVYEAMHYLSLLMKISHMRELLETQGITPLYNYIFDLRTQYFNAKTKALKKLLNDIRFLKVFEEVKELKEKSIEHPKLEKLVELINSIKKNFSDSNFKAIIFTQIRDEVEIIHNKLKELNIKSEIFIGQGKRKKKGLSQKQQTEIIEKLRNGEINVIISTSIGEEGLDIPEVDFVIFYEPVPSAIRSIQRRGRTGRQKEGNVFVLYTKDSLDENYKWVAIKREKKMYQYLKELKKMFLIRKQEFEDHILKIRGEKIIDNQQNEEEVKSKNQASYNHNDEKSEGNFHSSEREKSKKTLLEYLKVEKNDKEKNFQNKTGNSKNTLGKQEITQLEDPNKNNQSKPLVIIDQRERNNPLIKELVSRNIDIKIEQLPIGDYLISSKIAIEVKSANDFIKSIIDNRIFEQLKALKKVYEKPILIIQNYEELFHKKMHNNAILGAIASIITDYQVPIFFAENGKKAADFIEILAKRVQNNEKYININKPKQTLKNLLRFSVASFPGINYTLAEPLLLHFKTLRELINASEEELAMVEGIGKKRAKTLYEYFNTPYNNEK